MNYEELKALLQQAEEHNNSGNYNEAERLADVVLAELDKESDLIETGETNDSSVEGEVVAQSDRFLNLRCSTLITLSGTKWSYGDNQTALTLAYAALDLVEEVKSPELKSKAFGNIGIIYHNLSDYNHALTFHQRALAINEEIGSKNGIAGNLHNIGSVYLNLSDYANALTYCQRALAIFEELGSKDGIANTLGNMGIVYLYLSDYSNALSYYQRALAIHEELEYKDSIAINLGNIGNVYQNLSDYDNALNYYERALAICEEIGSKDGFATNLTGIGTVYTNLSDYDKALNYNLRALAVFEELGSKDGIASGLGNIGELYASLSDYANALIYFQRALAINEKIGSKYGVALNFENIGLIYAQQKFDGFDAGKAEDYLQRALAINREIRNKQGLYEVHKVLADLYEVEKRDSEALFHFKQYHDLEKEVQSEESKKFANLMEQRRQTAERNKEIEIAQAAAHAKHQATELLLHNVLPPSIANKMLDGTKLIAEKLPSVSVLFADIVGFTKLSQRITAEELVEGLDTIFSSFDILAEKHGLEKIKTIGDAYMVVSGAPEPRADHAEAMAHFALDMLEAMEEFTSKTTGEKIQLRIGIHSGEVVAGVIGKKKFAYDLWGDAVNTASRMESHGEAGRIHISDDFRTAVETCRGTSLRTIEFIERGEMDIKGKGIMQTFFLERVVL